MTKRPLALLLCFVISGFVFGQVEICDNGIDDDFDNLIDLNDPDCDCAIIEPVSVIPNPSFEDTDCCPSNRSELDCASLWIQASEPTTDYLNTCGWMGWPEFPPPQPFPDGDGIMGFRDGRVLGRNNNSNPEPYWKEYAGACLISPLEAGSSYRFEFDVGFVDSQKSPPINITFFGTANCDNLPFGVGNEAFGCPSNSPDWQKLGQVWVFGGRGNTWVNTFIEISPMTDINAIAIGPDCGAVPSAVSTYYFFDNLLLADVESFDFKITGTTHPCDSEYTMSIPNRTNYSYQWYKGGIALSGEITSELSQNYGEGTYQVRIDDGSSCRLSAAFEYNIPVYNTTPNVAICEGDYYQLGTEKLTNPGFYRDTLQTTNGCDSIVALNLEVIGKSYDTLAVSIVEEGEVEVGGRTFRREGDYPLTFTSSLGCDSLVLLQLTNFAVYVPNVFSPNFDDINDVFRPQARVGEMQSINMQIFDRWGGLVFQGTEWDGGELQTGVYFYSITIDFMQGSPASFYGAVTLLR